MSRSKRVDVWQCVRMSSDAATETAVDELARAWNDYLRLGARARDWDAWSALFTDDATYVEHVLGTFRGAAGVRAFIIDAMGPVRPMTFSLDWAILQPPHVAFDMWNHMPDPAGSGTMYSFSNLSLITYAGDGKWNWEEDFYAPKDPGRVIGRWYQAGGDNDMAPDPTISHSSLVEAPTADDPDGVQRMIDAWVSGAPCYADEAMIWTHGEERLPHAVVPTPASAGLVAPDLIVADGKRAFLRCANAGIALTHGGDGCIRFEERASNPNEAA